MKRSVGHGTIEVVQGDITKESVDAIVNAANSGLRGGGGVDGAIHRAGGPEIMAECRRLGGCVTGDAKMTTGGNLPAKWVIHAVGPVYRDGLHDEPRLLSGCFRRSLELARDHKLQSVAFPAISCGVYGYPLDLAAPLAVRTVAEFLGNNAGIDLVRFVLFDSTAYNAFAAALESLEA